MLSGSAARPRTEKYSILVTPRGSQVVPMQIFRYLSILPTINEIKNPDFRIWSKSKAITLYSISHKFELLKNSDFQPKLKAIKKLKVKKVQPLNARYGLAV